MNYTNGWNWMEAEGKTPHAEPDHNVPHDHHAHMGGFPETDLDLTGLDPADSRPLADATIVGGTA